MQRGLVLFLLKGGTQMELRKVILWGVAVLIGYHILTLIMPMFMWGLVGLIAWYCYLQYEEHRRK